MNTISKLLIFAGVMCLAFAYWGLETPWGRTHFDEMDGMIPFFVGIGGLVILIITAAVTVFKMLKR